jgi:hypothetical protein
MENFLNGITLLGIPALVLVPLVVQALKMLGLPVRWAGAASIVAGLAVAALAQAVTAWPAVAPFARVLVAGLLLGLSSAGAYSQVKTIMK